MASYFFETLVYHFTNWNGNSDLIYSIFSWYTLYGRGEKSVVFCFALLLPQILDDFQNQGQFQNLLVLTVSKHPLHVQFDQVLAEIFEVIDTRYHSFIFMQIDFRWWKKQKSEQFVTKIVLFTIKSTNNNKNNPLKYHQKV